MCCARSFLGVSFRLWGFYAIQEVDKCSTFGSQSNSQSSLYTLVESNHQSRQCLHWFPSTTRFDWYLYVCLRLSSQVAVLNYCFHRHGKISTLKICLIQIFRAHLWQKSQLQFYYLPMPPDQSNLYFSSSRKCCHGFGKIYSSWPTQSPNFLVILVSSLRSTIGAPTNQNRAKRNNPSS